MQIEITRTEPNLLRKREWRFMVMMSVGGQTLRVVVDRYSEQTRKSTRVKIWTIERVHHWRESDQRSVPKCHCFDVVPDVPKDVREELIQRLTQNISFDFN